jgi:integrase
MSVERRGTSVRVRYRDENGRNRSRTFATRDAALKFDRRIADLKAAGLLHTLNETPKGMSTLEDYARDVWWPDHVVPNAPGSLDMYARQLDTRIIPKWGGTRLRDLRPGPIEAWATRMLRDGTGEPTVQKVLIVMQSICAKAVRDEELDRNPLSAVRKPKAPRKRKPVAVTPLHVERMRAHMLDATPRARKGHRRTTRAELSRHRDATLLSFLAYSGPRPESEALLTRWEQIGSKTITVYPGGKKGAKERHTRLLKPLASDLKHWRLRSPESGPDDLIFGEWPDGAWKHWREDIFRPAAAYAGLPEHTIPRDLRGSFESLLIWSGEDVLTVASEVGHSAKVCLDTYGRVFKEFDAADRRPLEDLIAEARESVWGVQRAV